MQQVDEQAKGIEWRDRRIRTGPVGKKEPEAQDDRQPGMSNRG